MEHGLGGPPVFDTKEVLVLVAQMVERRCLDVDEVKSAIRSAKPL